MTQPARLGSHAVFGARKTWRRSLFAGLLGLLGVPGCSALAKTDQCEVNSDCIVGHGMPNSICSADKRCVSVLSPDCKEVLGAPLERDPLLVALLAHFSGTNSNYGDASKVSVQLALEDFKTITQGIPVGAENTPRQISVLLCDEANDALRAARHVTDNLQLPVLIGPVVSATTLKVAQEVTIPGQTLMINPFSVSETITKLEDNGLVWRTAVSNLEEGLGMAKFVNEYAEKQLLPPGTATPARVAVVNKKDVYGRLLASHFITERGRNCPSGKCASNLNEFEYPDETGAKSPLTAEMVRSVVAYQPNVVMLFGTSEMAEYVMSAIEATWPTANRPTYVLSEAVKTAKLLELVKQPPTMAALTPRIYLFGPKLSDTLKPKFENKWLRTEADPRLIDVYGVTGTYDALYLTVYAAVALRGQPFTGPNLAEALKKMVQPYNVIVPQVAVGDENIDLAFRTLRSGGSIDIEGITSPLNFDVNTGDAPGKYDVQCVLKGGIGYASTNLVFDTGTKALTEVSKFEPCS